MLELKLAVLNLGNLRVGLSMLGNLAILIGVLNLCSLLFIPWLLRF